VQGLPYFNDVMTSFPNKHFYFLRDFSKLGWVEEEGLWLGVWVLVLAG